MLTINNNKISTKYLQSKELLSFILKKTLENRLTILEQKNNKEKTNLLSMKQISNNMLLFLKESSQKLINKPHSKNNYSNPIIKKFTKTFTNKNKEHLQSRTPLETTPIKTKRKNSKERAFDNKIKKKKKMSITPMERSPIDRSRRVSKMSKKIIINTNNKTEMNSSKTNDNSSIIEQYRKKKPKMQLKKNNTALLLVTKQRSVMNLKKIENNNNNNRNRNRILHINNSHTVSPLRIKNKKLKKNHSKFRRKNNSVFSKKRSKRNINNNNEKEFKSSNTINSFYKSNKNDIKNEKKFNITKFSNIKNKLDLLYDNNLFSNDIRLNELNIDELQQNNNNNTISSPLHNTEDKDKTFSSLNQSLLKLTNEDDSLYIDNYLCNPSTYENNNYNNKISFEECLETSIEYICGYLPIKDVFSLGLINKEFYKIIIRYLISKTENKMENIKIQISELIKANNNTIDINEKEIKKFECNANSTRAITLLNSISKNNIFKQNSPLMNNKDIIFILELFFIAIGRKYDIIKYDNEEENISNSKKWNYACKYFKENDKKNLGVIFEKELINKKYNEEIINSLFEWSYKNIPKITPNYYKKIDKDIAIFVFIIKDLLDFFGISRDKKVNPQKIFVLYNIRLRVQDKLIQKLNKLLTNVK